MEQYKKSLAGLLSAVKEQKPLVHHITNFVTANDCANVVLALGGSPVMADDKNEVEEMVTQASSLVLNIGTLRNESLTSMILAGRKANELGIPVIFDPVGVGATQFRTKSAREILEEIKVSVLRGNMSEVKVLSGIYAKTRGVDSTADFRGGQEAALSLAQKYNCTVAITGEKDIISDGSKTILVENGHEMLTRVTGTGCMATSLVGTYCGVTGDYFLCALAGIVTMGLSGEKASQEMRGITEAGTFKVKLFDSIANFTPDDLMEGARLYV
ncbi:MAG: Hydroxyethylthiazole kinase [Firmicutes bacterium]|nr:Hydroxyethylthiazole kinase [Bacillota bacterium]MDI6704800.1 hydroxyethylthiazole kinase [Bacillota bacterium]